MRSTSSLGFIVLLVYFLCGAALSYRLPVDEVFRNELRKRLVCEEGDALLSFQQYTEDSVPFCSTYLSIGISTSTATTTGRTTVTTTTTVTTGIDVDAITVPTATITTTAGAVDKRQFVTPASELIDAACSLSPQQQSLLSTLSDACSCLTITPSVFDQTATVTSIRTITAIDYLEGTISGTAFDILTTTLIMLPSPVNATTVPTPSGIAPSSTVVPLSPSNTATVPFPSISAILRSPLPISSASPGSATTSGTVGSSGAPVVSINSTAPASSVSPGISSPSSATAVVSSSASNAPGGSTSLTSFTATAPPVIPMSGPPRSAPIVFGSPSVIPIGPANSTVPTPGVSSGASTGFSVFSSGIATGSSNITTPTSTSSVSSTTTLPPLGGVCPVENGTDYTTHGQTFLITCYINFPGPSNEGLDEPDLYACINECAQVNLGFSETNCFAASYFPNTLNNQNCYFKNKQDSQHPYTDYYTISAVLISGLPNVTTNATTSVSPTVSPSGSILASINSSVTHTLLPSVNVTSLPSFSSSVIGASSAPSGIPTTSVNSSSPTVPPFTQPSANRSGLQSSIAPSGSHTLSLNISSTGLASSSAPSVIPAVSTTAASGLPTMSSNSSLTGVPTISASSGLRTISSNSTSSSGSPSSGLPKISSNSTAMGTSSGLAASIPSGLPTISSNSSTPTVPSFPLPSVSDRSGFQGSTPSGISSASANITSSPSGFPTISANVTSALHIPSGFPSISINISSSHSLSIPIASDNKTTGLPTSTKLSSSTPSGFPTISSNATTPLFSQPTNSLGRNASFIPAPQNCTGCDTAIVTSIYTSIWTTTIVETSTSETVVTHLFEGIVTRSPATSAPHLQK